MYLFAKNTDEVVGTIGAVNMGVLAFIIFVRILLLRKGTTGPNEDSAQKAFYYKRLAVYLCLLLSCIVDLPYYISVACTGRVVRVPYAFHKLQAAFLFIGFSITVGYWGNGGILPVENVPCWVTVLYFILDENVIFVINLIYMSISLYNFAVCLYVTNLSAFYDSPQYYVTVALQVGVSLSLSFLMFVYGMRLSLHIQDAAEEVNNELLQSDNPLTNNGLFSPSTALVLQLERAQADKLRRKVIFELNAVMGCCCICIILQAIFFVLTYSMKMDIYVLWICFRWLPNWGIVLSLLYLSRSKSRRGVHLIGGAQGSALKSPVESSYEPAATTDVRVPLLSGDHRSGNNSMALTFPAETIASSL